MTKHLRPLAAAAAVLALAAAACGSPPPEEGGSGGDGGDGKAKDFKACMVSDSGGFDDKSFNETSHNGMMDAVEKLGISKGQLESQSDTDYPRNIKTLVNQDCNIIITVGFLLADATLQAAKKNPDVKFAIVDHSYPPEKNPPDNLKSLVFNAAQPSFLAGYVSASMSESGKVGTWGGEKIPTVTIFMDGFAQGVQHYNSAKNKNVQVVGWNPKQQDGTFSGGFLDKNKGKVITSNMMSKGVDIVHPVAGAAGLGAMEATKGSDASVVWVDTDGCVSAEQYCSEILTSAEKRMDVAVEKVITDTYKDNFSSKKYVGTLKNNGVALSPYHEFADDVPGKLKQEVKDLEQKLINGEIELTSPSQP